MQRVPLGSDGLLSSATMQQPGHASGSGFSPPPAMGGLPSANHTDLSPAAFLPPGAAVTANEEGGGMGGGIGGGMGGGMGIMSARPHPDNSQFPPDSPLDVLALASSDILQLT